ncbi:MAG TPA: phosphoribosyltransferase family protein [Acetobacteraceae bacterium]|nr:phosphoribosyltransferase family protein [Acetobacteraceae bacterium]
MAQPWKGLRTDRMPLFIGYDQAERMVAALLDRAAAWRPDAVVGVMRGGMVPATMVSCMLALPLFMIGWVRHTGTGSWIGPAPDGKRILLVDDCCATGETMRAMRDVVLGHAAECATLAIAYDPETTSHVPDFAHPVRELFRFPWERGEATTTARALRATGAPADRTTEAPFVGLDLDGVFLPDVPRSEYNADLTAALRRRQVIAPYTAMPQFARDRAVVITGRPEEDRAQTEAWLMRWGYSELTLECRPAEVPGDVASVARYKAATATRWGCTHFVESDPEQAIRIAALAPHLVVSWWSADETRAWIIGAARQPDR